MARRARSLDTLVAEVNAAAPKRNKGSDGWLGDPAHQARPSRHNPNDSGVVCAQDITHDPAGGCDIHAIARRIVAQGPPRDCEYIISNDQVAKRSNGWQWVPYSPNNPKRNKHIAHAHFAVGRGPESEPTQPYDDTDPWGVAPDQEDDMTPDQAEQLARIEVIANENRWNYAQLAKLVAAADPKALAVELAKLLPIEGDQFDQAAIEAALRSVFKDAAVPD